uniref:Motile sperm domain-containing protein 1 n=1 Tax=Caligus rogercresseyi TaxID=217165 RepID=C1BNG4_CALRO|nr:Motile sperm domain-containing protein 1 [Caligus rogercresseyi]ACO10614.1 Motile sperm domain-containing protein 1 [Caligus rogercresseyi]|eukprot:TRINITY_DN2698_c0_g1_i1.p1 TRINITY_DN2698_c0_g1~~TRINITY_DN2698_c0_g1_i1.p1  ORF type:complete len:223 (+),score=55.14 TRINITY_DN2698_c0_g1_i1:142-810(+)
MSVPSGVSSMPVIVFPGSMDFYLGDPSTHKRILTLYNPSEDLAVHYKVMCTNPSFYAVVEPLGTILPLKCTDIVVRHVAVSSPQALLKVDKFRLTLSLDKAHEGTPVGKRDILATLHSGVPEPESGSASLPHGQQQKMISSTTSNSSEHPQLHREQRYEPPPNYVACIAAVICIVALFLPTEGEESALGLKDDYPWLILTLNQKLAFAYVLGLVTMAILRVT